MNDKKTIVINKNVTIIILLSFILSFLSFYFINHLGDFTKTYLFDAQVDSQGKLTNVSYMPIEDETPLQITFRSPWGLKITDYKSNYIASDAYKNGKMNTYLFKSKYYLDACLEQFHYIVFMTIFLSAIIYFFKKYKFTLK